MKFITKLQCELANYKWACHKFCRHHRTKCPFSRFSAEVCVWEGVLSNLKEHILEEHSENSSDYFKSGDTSELHFKNVNTFIHFRGIINAKGELFYLVCEVNSDTFSFAMVNARLKSETRNVRYRLTLRSENGDEIISICKKTSDFHQEIEEILRPGECVKIPLNYLRKFIVGHVLKCELEFTDRESESFDTRMQNEDGHIPWPTFSPRRSNVCFTAEDIYDYQPTTS